MTTGRLWRVQFMGRYMISTFLTRRGFPIRWRCTRRAADARLSRSQACVKVTETVYDIESSLQAGAGARFRGENEQIEQIENQIQ